MKTVVVVALTAFPYISSAHREMSVGWSAEFVAPLGCRIGTLERLCFCEMTVCDEQINLSEDRCLFAVGPWRHS